MASYLLLQRNTRLFNREGHLRRRAGGQVRLKSFAPHSREHGLRPLEVLRVRIGKRLFLVRRVVFGGSKWRLPTRLSVANNASEGEGDGR